MISRLYYVSCDRCGKPCGDSDHLQTTVREARQVARRKRWTRIPGRRYERGADYCPECVP